MSMYSQLLDAAVVQRGPVGLHPTVRSALETLQQCGRDRNRSIPPASDPDVVLAREIAYDVALLELSAVMGIDTEVRRFAQPQRERARLEEALRDRGVAAPSAAGRP